MRIAAVFVVLYWVLFTITKEFGPRVSRAERAARYDLNNGPEEQQKKARRAVLRVKAGKAALRVAGWLKFTAAVFLVAWLVWLIGALMAGTYVIFGVRP
ncbi:MAG: hypothetical protein HFE80_11980 [Clostridiaceae bacterium]|nr:hypothetical protein [Clostridiaceae bacterium]